MEKLQSSHSRSTYALQDPATSCMIVHALQRKGLQGIAMLRFRRPTTRLELGKIAYSSVGPVSIKIFAPICYNAQLRRTMVIASRLGWDSGNVPRLLTLIGHLAECNASSHTPLFTSALLSYAHHYHTVRASVDAIDVTQYCIPEV